MTEIDKRARIAGALYLLSSLPGFFSLRYVPDALIVRGDIAATLANIMRSETLFRLGVGAELMGAALWVFLICALYRLFVDVDRGQAGLMAVLGLMIVPIMFLNVLSELAVLTMLHDAGFAAAFSPPQTQGLAALALRLHSQGFTIAGVFWGLWLFPFGILVWRSGFLPRVLGALLGVGGLGWVAASATALIAPAYSPLIGPAANIATQIGELPIIFWLLIMGAKLRPPAAPVGAKATP